MLRPEVLLAGEALAEVCRRYGITRLSVFGSALRTDFRPDSDLDLLAEFVPGTGLERFAAEAALSALVGRRVDLIDRGALLPRLREGILASERLVYERHADGSETLMPLRLDELEAPVAKDERAYLEDMLTAAVEIEAVVADIDRGAIAASRIVYLALLHLVQTIGEAASKVSLTTRQQHPEVPWAAMVGMRNHIVHGYDRVDDEVLWRVVREEVGPLTAAVRRLLAEGGRATTGETPAR
jgi:uncharacterized protein with HEPN domain/predicted nucleotidyltransferase